MCQRRIDVKRELGIEVLKCEEIVELIMVVGLMKIVADLGPCYEKLVQEFIMSLSTEVEDKKSQDCARVFVRDKCIKFSPKVINVGSS